MEIVSYSSSKGAISVGVNFNPMYRHKIFRYEPIKEFCVFKIQEAAEKYGKRYQFKLNEIGAEIDHLHVLVTFGPNTKFCDVMKSLKEYSAKAVFKAFPWLRGCDEMNILGKGTNQKLFTNGHFWSGGYYFESYGRKTFDSHKKYVAEQGLHHKLDRSQTRLNNFIAA
jgi:REP element-mobilizing transposase RayT|tara:strand:- start:1129 stop:1632 length:504 start_codon:yes stop_codon:yes gene_type:complete